MAFNLCSNEINSNAGNEESKNNSSEKKDGNTTTANNETLPKNSAALEVAISVSEGVLSNKTAK